MIKKDEWFIKTYNVHLTELFIGTGTQLFYLIGIEHRDIIMLHKLTIFLSSMIIEANYYVKSSDSRNFGDIYSNLGSPQATITRGN